MLTSLPLLDTSMSSVASDYNATECPISLPPELLLHIFSFLSTASGSTVAQVSKRFNILVTPLVWTTIKLSDLLKARQYLATCSLLGSQHDLLSMVRSFEIELLAPSVRNCSLMAEHAAAEGVEELLPKILDWMQNLEHFRFVSERWAFQGDFILDMVGHKSALKSLKLDLAAFLLCGDTISAANLPNLETLYLTANCASVGGRIQNWISNLVDDHTALINDFQIHGIRPEKIIPNNDDSWSSLQTLRIACSGLYMPYALKMPHVKQLSIPVPYLNGRNRDPVTPAPPIFPDLEVLRALPETVMRSGLLKGRPIHTLELDDIHLYEDDGVYSAGVGRVAPENETLANIFHQLKESSTPLRSLSFLMKALQIDFLLHCLMPFKHLRYLKLMISVGWLVDEMVDFGERVLPVLSNLETLVFEDCIEETKANVGYHSRVEQEGILDRWSAVTALSSRPLCHVSFTPFSRWKKNVDVWAEEPLAGYL